ncbi:MAG: hypothetical protein ACI4P7_02420 [Bacilli bacterium]|nr:hypothetical protein [Mollicutes bacterium]
MKEFDSQIEKLRVLYNEKPTETINEINKAIINLKNETNEDVPEKKYSRRAVISGLFAVCIFLISITNINYGSEQFMMYFFGTVFFLAGLFIGLNVPVFGIIFLFSHGGTGLGIMCFTKINKILQSPIMTDNPTNLQNLLVLGVGLIVIGIISTIFYNVSKKIRDKKYSLIIILAMFAIGIAIIQLLPMIYNIPFES